MQPVYRVVFYQKDLWEGYEGTDNDNLEIEVGSILVLAIAPLLPGVCCFCGGITSLHAWLPCHAMQHCADCLQRCGRVLALFVMQQCARQNNAIILCSPPTVCTLRCELTYIGQCAQIWL